MVVLFRVDDGLGWFIVLDEDQCIVKHTLSLAYFYMHESCGQCTPLPRRIGWMYRFIEKIEEGEAVLKI